ncbi:MAG TPA: FKBP-type peptidyl-prolyl cis-trans isomerase [Vicinamibacterales bacterium]|nr:FKBP-type peptidyl-prolyl cis-trans isomerase [Vicinamibacterales bacterium]
MSNRFTWTSAGASVGCLALLLLIGCGGGSSNPAPTAPDQSSVAFSQTDVVVGTGPAATVGKALTVNYTGWLYSDTATDHKGAVFGTSVGSAPFSFTLGSGQVIAGWDQGLVGMKVGGLRRLTIPPSLAYGSSGNGPVPPNAALVFDIQLLSAQ